jgi:hypothetical protein
MSFGGVQSLAGWRMFAASPMFREVGEVGREPW